MERPLTIVLPGPTGMPFLEVAFAGRADVLIAGNIKHFKPRRGDRDVHICTPSEFVRSLA